MKNDPVIAWIWDRIGMITTLGVLFVLVILAAWGLRSLGVNV